MVLNLGNGYSPRFGKVIDQMPILIGAGETPIAVDHLLERRVAFPDTWGSTYIFTGDAAILGVKGDALIELDSLLLRSVNKESEILDNALVLSDEEWEERRMNPDNLYLIAEQVVEAIGAGYVKQNGIWKPENRAIAEIWDTLGRGKDLHEYAELASSKSNRAKHVMQVYFAEKQRKVPTMRAWCVDNLDDRSSARGDSDLDYDNGRLVGVAPEALAAYKARVAYQKN